MDGQGTADTKLVRLLTIPAMQQSDLIIGKMEDHLPEVCAALQNQKAGKLHHDKKFRHAIEHIAMYRACWIRKIENWRRPGRNKARSFASLVRHLFARYPVPEFMDSVWFHRNYLGQEMDWFIMLGHGSSIRTLPGIVPMSKKEAHWFRNAPSHLDCHEAICWAQVKAIGGDERIFMALKETLSCTNAIRNPFWKTVIQFMANHHFEDKATLKRIFRLIAYYKFGYIRVRTGTLWDKPFDPSFSMKGRSQASLVRLLDPIVQQLENKFLSRPCEWMPDELNGFHYQEHPGQPGYRIVQLLTSRDLINEGRRMNHCVGSYYAQCVKGQKSVWSIRRGKSLNGKSIATIALNPGTKTVVEAKGVSNRDVPEEAEKVLRAWVKNENLKMSEHWFG